MKAANKEHFGLLRCLPALKQHVPLKQPKKLVVFLLGSEVKALLHDSCSERWVTSLFADNYSHCSCFIQQLKKILSSTSLLLLETGGEGGQVAECVPSSEQCCWGVLKQRRRSDVSPLALLNKGAASTKRRGGQQDGESGTGVRAAPGALLVLMACRLHRRWLIKAEAADSPCSAAGLFVVSVIKPMDLCKPSLFPPCFHGHKPKFVPTHLLGVKRITERSVYVKIKWDGSWGYARPRSFRRKCDEDKQR